MPDLARKRERERLPARREPHWQRLFEGAYLGFRRGPDTWVARYRDRSGKQHYSALGGPLEYDGAKGKAEEWLRTIDGAAARIIKRGTVKDALEAYLKDLRETGRAGTAKDALWRFKLTVYEDPLAQESLEDITREDLKLWRKRLQPGREPRTVNRYVRGVVAGLNWAVDNGHLGNPAAWRLDALRDDVEEDGETAIFLAPSQRAGLIAAAEPRAKDFLRGLELTGARPIELAAATAGDFDGTTLRLAHRKGRPPRLRARQVVLSPNGVKFFQSVIRGKLPGAPIFTEDGEQPWRRHIWAREVRDAIAKHNAKAKGKARIPVGASAYSFRHARISELLQVYGVDPLTVAAQTGTSLAMIEKAYHRFIPSALHEKLRTLKERR